jgi:hypothetical protein
MGKRFQLTESEINEIKKLYSLNEEEKENKKFCHGGNTKSLEEIVGDDEDEDYIDGVKLRKNGIKGMVDRLELLKSLRIHPKISDGGEHLCYDIMNKIKNLKPYNYFDETKKECSKVIDKIIELYKENEHGEELVKDIEKVMASSQLSPRAKEFLKHSIGMIKGQ